MRVIPRRLTIQESGDVVSDNIKITDFNVLEALIVDAYGHGSTVKKLGTVSIMANHLADSAVMIDIDNYTGLNKRKTIPLFIHKPLIQNTNISIQVRDTGAAVSYPYDIIITFFCKMT